MRKTLLLASTLLAMLTACTSQKTASLGSAVSHIDVELLNQDIDLDMDISQLGVTDLHILQNAFAARRGYPFEDAFLRNLFYSTTWYDSLMWNFDEQVGAVESSYDEALSYRGNYYRDADKLLNYTEAEKAFIQRVKEREAQLLEQNFKAGKGLRVNMQNVYNAMQLTEFDPLLRDGLAKNGFAIVPAEHIQLFHVYEQNDYSALPNFVTTDLYLQLYHLYVDCLLRDLEQNGLYDVLAELVRDLYTTTNEQAAKAQDPLVSTTARHNSVYFAIAYELLTGHQLPLGEHRAEAQAEIDKVMKAENDFSDFIGEYDKVTFPYSLFRPRGHYTRSDKLQRYFRAMMWLQSVPFGLDDGVAMQLEYVVQMADAFRNHPRSARNYERINRVLTYLMGQPDNLSLTQVADEVQRTGLTTAELLNDKAAMGRLRHRLNALGDRQTRIRPKFERTSHNKVCFLPQRYQPDAEVLQETVDYDSEVTRRDVPKGLDIMAAMGCTAAERILLDEIGENRNWSGYQTQLNKMKQRMDSIDWQQSIATQWLSTLKTVTEQTEQMPYFMQTPEWDKKSLNAALGSWAELKHDAILYAKQPMGAECGDGGPPGAVLKSYVEPNVKFWSKAISLLDNTASVLKQHGVLSEKSAEITERMRDEAEFLLAISEKELSGKPISDEEYDQLEYIGATAENLSIELIREPDQELYAWEAVQGPDRNMAVVADVYTANADNNRSKSILYAAVGQADEIYIVVEVDGLLYLMRGAVLSYREFKQPVDAPRLTDEEWQQQLKQEPRKGVPGWMDDITVPLKNKVVPNEEVFYSSGC